MFTTLTTDTNTVRFASSRSIVPAFLRLAMARAASMLDMSARVMPWGAMPSYAMSPAPVSNSAAGHSFTAVTCWLDDAGVATCGFSGNPTALKRIHPGRLGGVT